MIAVHGPLQPGFAVVPPDELLVEAPELEPPDEPEDLDEPLPLELLVTPEEPEEPEEPPLEPVVAPEEPEEPPLEPVVAPEDPDDPLLELLPAAPEEPELLVLGPSQLSESHSTNSLRPQLMPKAHTAHRPIAVGLMAARMPVSIEVPSSSDSSVRPDGSPRTRDRTQGTRT